MKNVILKHLMNFKLWHIEDIARRRNIDHETIANYKHEIDLYPERLCVFKDTQYISKSINASDIKKFYHTRFGSCTFSYHNNIVFTKS